METAGRRTPFMMEAVSTASIVRSLLVILIAITLQAAPQAGISRPQIGLALSGGGARGMAHIGVLRWFEEHHVPVDYIAGTSMGGLAAGMYATGMTPDDMTTLVEATDWDLVLSSGPSYPDLSFRRKEDRREFSTSIEFGLKNGARLPRGLNDGHLIGLILDRVMLPYDTITSFDDLPVPFRTLATELVSGELVVFDSGSLPDALRATMSLPGIFTPFVSGDRIYADGGILNNIPTDIVRDMGADVVVAVNVGSPLLGFEDLDDLIDILGQSVAVMGIQNDRRNLELADVALVPELGMYTLMDFSNPGAVIEIGYRAAEAQADALLRYQVDDATWEAYLEDRLSRERTLMPVPGVVEVEGTNPRSSATIRKRLSRYLDAPLDWIRLEDDLTHIVGGGRFASLGYRVADGTRLVIGAREKSHGPPFVRMGLDIDAATEGTLNLSIGGRMTFMDLGAPGAEWRTDLRIGTEDVARSEYYRPFGGSAWFFAMRAGWEASTEGLFDAGNRIAELRTREKRVGLDLGFQVNGSSEIRAGYEIRSLSASVQTGDPGFTGGKGHFGNAFLHWVYDGRNQPLIPTRGIYVRLESRWFSEAENLVEDLVRTELEVSALVPVSQRGSVFLNFNAGRASRGTALPVQQFTLGGPFRLSAWNRGEFRDPRFGVASVGYLHDVAVLPPLVGDRLYAAGFYEVGRLYTAPNPSDLLHDFALAIGTRSPLGALWLGGAWGEGGQAKAFFRIGTLF